MAWCKRSNEDHLPLPFCARYCHVVSIIDCLEIQIEEPSDLVFQTLTWSTYYNCNFSCHAHLMGLSVLFQMILVDESQMVQWWNNLYPGFYILADSGFKNVSALLQRRNCTLIQPSSVSQDTQCSREEVKQSKQITALCIHVKLLIGRVREFRMLSPHACVDRGPIEILDYAVIIACGIINLQDNLIKWFFLINVYFYLYIIKIIYIALIILNYKFNETILTEMIEIFLM